MKRVHEAARGRMKEASASTRPGPKHSLRYLGAVGGAGCMTGVPPLAAGGETYTDNEFLQHLRSIIMATSHMSLYVLRITVPTTSVANLTFKAFKTQY
jgi:hypothetical protein